MRLAAATPNDRPLLALLVDRDSDTRLLYAESLEHNGWRVEEASNGPTALAKAIALRPDVVVTETRLSGLDGLALCALLRQDLVTRTIPVIVVTGDAFAEDIERANEAGASLVLTKPCLPDQLSTAIKALLEESRRIGVHGPSRGRLASAGGDHRLRGPRDTASRRSSLKKAHLRGDTITPTTLPPLLMCPECDQRLAYQRSHIGGVSSKHPEQWDYFECPGRCGTFQYRLRTRKLRKVS